MAAAPPPCGAPTAWVGVGAALPPQQSPVRRRHARSFELREDMGADRLQAVEDWLRVEGYAYRLRQKRWRVWTRPDRPGEGLRPDGIEEDENPNEYPSGATINVSMWDMIEKKFPEPGNERTLQGSSSSASPGKEKRSAGDKKRDKKLGGVPGIPGRQSRPSRQGRNSSPQPRTGQWRSPPVPHHPWRLPRSRQAGQGQAPSAAPEEVRPEQRRGVGPPREDAGRPGQLQQQRRSRPKGRGPRLRARLWGALQPSGCPETGHAAERCRGGCRRHRPGGGHKLGQRHGLPRLDRGGHCGRTAAAQEAATARVRGEVAAAAEEARLAQEAIARNEAEVKALEGALAQEKAKREAKKRAHAEATAKAQADAARIDAIEAARRRVAEERAKTEAELAALEAEKARLQRAREAEAARAREEAERRAAAATAAAMEEAEAKLQRETSPGGSRVQTLRKLFEGDACSKMTLDLEEVDTGSSGDSGPTAYRRRKGKGKTPERSRRPAGGHPHDSDPFFTASDRDGRGRRHRRGVAGGGGGDVPIEPEGGGEDLPPPYRSSESSACETETTRWGDMDEDDDMDFDYTEKHPSSDPPR